MLELLTVLTVFTFFTFYRLVLYWCLHVCLQLWSNSCSVKETFDLIMCALYLAYYVVQLPYDVINNNNMSIGMLKHYCVPEIDCGGLV